MTVRDGMNTGKLPYTRFFATNRPNIVFIMPAFFNPSQKDRADLLRNASKTVKSGGFICD
ncbi:hypothetical protein NB644_04525 [Oxalobacter formigenes]|uniref:hypothetical protein n=2 Tax=Oxalobacter formigenes TaxID=847 RepID=UPI000569C767|nr:hypothetical protein [Oxalobacter formigenes]ARQ77893.1 hypothetical protein BRW84_04140 [Oxalobacter formigenes OXCC13]MCZ4062082.1 hypothetical protein [Oxalobacter formigenes]QDX33560.1 hypothetical protein FPZ51_08265 [Oxalobacter formigenes]WAW02299.1 hypothetical protein NB644_04525 [Oxalobacter formigenes]WAW08499.1 hypothetical protein NB638_03395 [Oxalobacter formigenes]